jgi:DNA sulfur modification protein DndE
MPIEHIRLSKQAREQLIRLKRHTGVEHWNVLCRWAFCRSLAEETPTAPARIPADSNVEMSWKVFGGRQSELYLALLKARCLRDGVALDDDTLSQQFRLHLHRGIGYLANDRRLKGISALVELAPRAGAKERAPQLSREAPIPEWVPATGTE